MLVPARLQPRIATLERIEAPEAAEERRRRRPGDTALSTEFHVAIRERAVSIGSRFENELKSVAEPVADETQEKILKLLDTLALEIAGLRTEERGEIGTLRTEMREGFERVERRLGQVETRVESIEMEQRSFRHEFERRIAPLER